MSDPSRSKGLPLSEWKPGTRPRERLIEEGADKLSDAELLAVMLGTGSLKVDVIGLAQEVLDKFGSLANITSDRRGELMEINGIGPASYSRILAGVELANRVIYQRIPERLDMQRTKQYGDYLMARLGHRQREVFACMFLDIGRKLIKYEELFLGTIDSSRIHPREIVDAALRHSAASVILAHNHPSGQVTPSDSDIRLTHRLREILGSLDVDVVDHCVVARGRYLSMRLEGLMSP
ncbi:MAG: DNA repair protein RadC [Gammaproteobacteria bacterium AqS3]|nr:DNA repair protein RadC [Gammaproteobacteria bacterium AqS3]